ncbi:MAG: hypothetical protein KF881_06605 [Acidobacteria bacterium]|nr:hypothetical protein [Acidobacteriota bacterium]
MQNAAARFQLLMELRRLGERAFVQKLRQKHPDITQEEINKELCTWYRIRPGAEFGDGVGRVGDMSRFEKNN